MFTMQTILEQLTGSRIAQALVQTMADRLEDFAQAQERYTSAMATLQTQLGDGASPSVTEDMQAIEQQTVSGLLFSGMLGLKANLDNFIDPIRRNFLEADPETYLREETARRLPEYANAQKTRDRFYAQLSPTQQKLYADVITYTSHLETVGPKLAHYCGYILGNELLPRVVPGYHPDRTQSRLYTAMLNQYFGKDFDLFTLSPTGEQ